MLGCFPTIPYATRGWTLDIQNCRPVKHIDCATLLKPCAFVHTDRHIIWPHDQTIFGLLSQARTFKRFVFGK